MPAHPFTSPEFVTTTAIQPCPPWCDRDHMLPDFPEDGFWHYGPATTLGMSRPMGSPEHPGSMDVRVQAWVPVTDASPEPALVTLTNGDGLDLTPTEARALAALLIHYSDLAESS